MTPEARQAEIDAHMEAKRAIEPQVWPCHVDEYHLFTGLQTQWNSDMGTRLGLRYEAVVADLTCNGFIPGETRTIKLYNNIKIMESACLRHWHSKKSEDK